MNPAIKAALFSALLFPGWGQIYLKKYMRGILIMIPVLAGIVLLTWSIVRTAYSVLKATPLKKGTVDLSAIVNLTVNSVKALDIYPLLISFLLIIFCWVFSIIDAYLLGKKVSMKSL